MDLALDFGNSFLKAAVFEGDEISDIHIQSSRDSVALRHFLEEKEFGSCIISSVIDLPGTLLGTIRERCLEAPVHLTHKTPLPITNRYSSASTLGKDRIALACGAASLYPGEDVLVIDGGTCITYDFVNKEGEYLGGAISPGASMRFNALSHFTYALPQLKIEADFKIIGASTKESILSGVLNGVLFEINGFIDEYRKKYPQLKIIISGGDTDFFVNRLNYRIFAHPELVLTGLIKILKFNVNK